MPFHVPEFLAPRGCASSRDARWRSLALAHLTALACGAVVAAGLLAAPLASGDDPTPSAPAATPTEAPTESALPALKVFDPCFTGKLSVGNTLTAVLGPVEGEIGGVKVEYQWLRDGEAIAGATSKSYTLVEDDAGTGVSVRITASKPGYITEVRESCNRRI
ncbi:MAG: hypothetical protein LBJ08_09270, partial [Bifidobacteriaceae bacterium]|nr:hypothetical protein [Bifidobacteriaceae bacterium]